MDQLHLFSVFVAVVDANGFAGAARKLQQRGVPQRPEDLAAHDIVSASAVASGAEWRLVKAGAPCVVKLQPGMISTTSEAALAAAVGGFGLTRSLSYQVADRLRDGPLKIVLGDFEPAALCRCTWSIAKAATRRGRRASCWTWRSSACVPIRPCSRFWLRRACQRTSVARDWALALLQGGRKFPPAGRRRLQRPGHRAPRAGLPGGSSSAAAHCCAGVWQRVWSKASCLRIPTSQVRKGDRLAKLARRSGAASTASEPASSAHAGLRSIRRAMRIHIGCAAGTW